MKPSPIPRVSNSCSTWFACATATRPRPWPSAASPPPSTWTPRHQTKLGLTFDPFPIARGDVSEPVTFVKPREGADKKDDKGKEGVFKDVAGKGPELKASDLLAAAKDKYIYHQVDANTIVLRK